MDKIHKLGCKMKTKRYTSVFFWEVIENVLMSTVLKKIDIGPLKKA